MERKTSEPTVRAVGLTAVLVVIATTGEKAQFSHTQPAKARPNVRRKKIAARRSGSQTQSAAAARAMGAAASHIWYSKRRWTTRWKAGPIVPMFANVACTRPPGGVSEARCRDVHQVRQRMFGR